MFSEDGNEHMDSRRKKPDDAFDYRGTPEDKADFEVLAAENAAERLRRERVEEIQKIQEDFDIDTEKIHQERIHIEGKKEVDILQEKVERLKREYNAETTLRNKYVDAERNRGFLRKAWEFFFVPRNASTSDRLNIIALDERVRQSLSAYRAAKKELEDAESSISKDKESLS
ncbi:MAG: hypothetical protein IPJ67_00760 [Candidatus Moraniibacteriota bacterium]|nr:MAG: hypothetical protein IPJ67_00760 [Candidatus Moranbacteria bacterium]